jgi:hypothetical protein
MQKGSLLEITLRIVQESLKNNETTEIYSNFRIENTSGRKREFDIVIKTIINGFDLIVVIECKDYENPVPVEKLEAFHSKCLRIPKINKKIFVSRNGFQADSIHAANEFGIECYDIQNIDPETVKTWCAISLIKPIARYIQINQTRLWSEPHITDLTVNLDSTIYQDDETNSSTVKDFILSIIKQSDIYPNQIYFKAEGKAIDRIQTYSIEADSIEGLFLVDSNRIRHDIYKMFVVFELVEKEVEAKVTVERIKSTDREMSTVITHDTEGDESIKLILKDGNPNVFDPFIVNKKTGEIIDSGYTFEYKKKDENK